MRTGLCCLLAFACLSTVATAAQGADDATAAARSHYEIGLRLFDARQHDQALLEFRAANNLKPRPAALFMMAQCEYLIGQLKAARTHYEQYARENPDGEFVELAKDRIESIDKRSSTFVINTVPDDVDVRIASETTPALPPIT
jgi:tetratricopeptide (TPR) repeat protein